MFTPFLGLPLPVLVQHQQVFFRRPIFGSGLGAGIRPLVREGEGEALGSLAFTKVAIKYAKEAEEEEEPDGGV